MLLFTFVVIIPLCVGVRLGTASQEAQDLFDVVDVNGDGAVTLSETIAYFNLYDANHDGRVSRHEFTEFTLADEPDTTQEQIHTMFELIDFDKDHHLEINDYIQFFNVMDPDGDGIVPEAEFVRYWTSKFQEIGLPA